MKIRVAFGFALTTLALLAFCNPTFASDKKAKGRAAWAWASACSSGSCAVEVKTAIKETPSATVTKQEASVKVVEQSSGDCTTSGTWGTTRSSRVLFGRRR